MTINSEIRKVGPFIGNGTASAFPFTFKVFQASDLEVVRLEVSTNVETVLTLNSQYTVTLNVDQDSNPGGTVTLIGGALASGYTLTLTSDVPYLQPTDLTNQGGFYPDVINDALDRATIQIQQLGVDVNRSLKVPVSSTVSTELPNPSANELLGWDSTGTSLTNVDPSTLATVVAYATAYADVFIGDGVTTSFVLTRPAGSLYNLDVSIQGVTQEPVRDYTMSGTTITFTTAPFYTHRVLVKYKEGLPNYEGDSQDVRYLPAGTGAVATTVQAKLRETVSVKDFGAVGDGVTDDTVAIQNAINSDKELFISAGTYVVSDDLTFDKFVNFQQDSVLQIATGKTVAFNFGINAGVYQIFDCQGTAEVTFQNQIVGYPEWWGAVTDDNTVDNIPYLEACVAAVYQTQLQNADYWTASTWNITQGQKKVSGISRMLLDATTRCTRIVCTSGTDDVMHVAPASVPSGITEFLWSTEIENVQLSSSVVPTPPVSGNAWEGRAGLRAEYCYNFKATNIYSNEHTLGYAFTGMVYSIIYDCQAFRSAAGSSPTYDYFYGFLLNGDNGSGQFFDGQASLYLDKCNASIGGSPVLAASYGLGSFGSFNDIFIDRFECTNTDYGVAVNGAGSVTGGRADFHLRSAVLDQVKYGIWLFDMGEQTLIDIVDPYVANVSNATTNKYLIRIQDVLGAVSIIGGQSPNWGDPATDTKGLWLQDSKGIVVEGYKMSGVAFPVYAENIENYDLRPVINGSGKSFAHAAIAFTGTCQYGKIEPILRGTTAFTQGIFLTSTGTQYTECNVSGIASNSVSNKLVYNGTNITTVGAFGTTNYASGVMA